MINSPISTLSWLRMFTCYISVQWDIIKNSARIFLRRFCFPGERIEAPVAITFLIPSALRVDVMFWYGQPFCYHENIRVATLAPWNWITTGNYLSLKTFYYPRKNESIFIKHTACNECLREAGSIPSYGKFFTSGESKLNISSHAFGSPIVYENTNGMDLRPDPVRLWEI